MGKIKEIDLEINQALLFLNENKKLMTPKQIMTMQRIVSKCIQSKEMQKMRDILKT